MPVPELPNSPPRRETRETGPAETGPVPNSNSDVANLDGFAAAPRTMLPAKPYPVTGLDPRAAISSMPVESPLRAERDATGNGIVPAPVPSKTPGLIRPVHPGDRVATDSSGHTSPLPSGGLQMPAVAEPSASPEFDPKPPADDYALNPESKRPKAESPKAESPKAKSAPTPSSGDAVAIAPPKTRLFRAPSATEPNVAESTPSDTELAGKADNTGSAANRPSLAETEGYRPTTNRPPYVSAAKPTVDIASSSDGRPQRLGAASGPVKPTIAGRWSREKAERGVDPGPVTMNPFASRPTVELAERPSESDDGVIYQPNSASTKR
jgi:hypothetical protein